MLTSQPSLRQIKEEEWQRQSDRDLIVSKRYSSVSFQSKSCVKSSMNWFNHFGIERCMNTTWRGKERQRNWQRNREIDSSLQARDDRLGKKAISAHWFFLLVEWRVSIWKSLSAIWSSGVFTHVKMDSSALLKMRINTHTHTQSTDCLLPPISIWVTVLNPRIPKSKRRFSDMLLTYLYTHMCLSVWVVLEREHT